MTQITSTHRAALRWAAVVVACLAAVALAVATLGNGRLGSHDDAPADRLGGDGNGGAGPTPQMLHGPATAEIDVDDVEPALAYIETEITGFVGLSQQDGTVTWSEAIVLYSSCTGFALTPDGDIATAGHCLEYDDEMRESFILPWLDQLIDDGTITTPADYDAYYDYGMTEAPIEGQEPGSEPALDFTVYIGDEVLPAQVEESQSVAYGGDDAGLLNVSPEDDLPTLTVAQDNPGIGADVVSVGYPMQTATSFTGEPADRPNPSYKEGSVSSVQPYEGAEFLELSADLGPGMSGGPTLDAQTHEVVGINSYGYDDGGFNFATSTETVQDMLGRHGIVQDAPPSEPEDTEQGSPAGPDTDSDTDSDRGSGGATPDPPLVQLVVAILAAVGAVAKAFRTYTKKRRARSAESPASASGMSPALPGSQQ